MRSLAAAILLLITSIGSGETPSPSPVLVPGMPMERPLMAGGVDHLLLQVEAGRHWRLGLEQIGIDLVMEVTDPRGQILLTIDGPFGREGWQSLLLTPQAIGFHRVSIRSEKQGVPNGRYEIRLDELPAATSADRLRLRAERVVTEAFRLGADRDLVEALEVWRALEDRHQQARTLLLMGRFRDRLKDYRQSVASYEQALALWRELNDRRGLAATLSRLGFAYQRLGEYPQAISYLEEALALRQLLGQREREIETRTFLGLAFQRAGRWPAAAECYEKALALAREQGDAAGEATLLNNLGGIYKNLGEPTPALDYFKQALELRRAMGNEWGEATTLNNLGALHRGLGEVEEALLYYDPALAVFERLGDRKWQARVLNNIGVAYLSLGEFERARAYLLRGLPLRRAVSDLSGEATTLRNLGLTFAGLGDSGKALAFYRKTLDSNLALGDRRGAATTRKLLGKHFLAWDEPAAARRELELALAALQEMGKRSEEAEVLELLSRVHLALAEPQKAVEFAEQALDLHRAVDHPAGEVAAHVTLARAERELGRPGAVRAHLEAALEALEDLQGRLGDPKQRASFLASQRAVYELNVAFLMELDRARPNQGHALVALAASEQARSRSLVGLLEGIGASLGPAVEPELRERLRSAERRLMAKTRRQLSLLDGPHTAAQALATEQDLYAALAELENARAESRRRSPRYTSLARSQTLDAAGVQDLLDDDTTLMEFLLGEDRSFLWWVTVDRITTYELPPRRTIEELAERVHQQVSTIHRPSGAAREVLDSLGQMLLGPVADRLVGQRLVIVADGALHSVPFVALTSPRTGQSLLQHHEVVHLPSASLLALQRRERLERPVVPKTVVPKTVAILADPIFDRRDPRITVVGDAEAGDAEVGDAEVGDVGDRGLGDLDRLPHTWREAQAIAALLPADQYLLATGGDARRSRVVGDGLSAYRILHFATHGFFNPRTPELSGLALSRMDERGNELAGFLGLYDVSNLELSAELVVLSGCQTALGKQIRGEGLVGLTRGFMYAGVPRVVASFWQVRDQATAELMTRFYRAMLVDGVTPAAALRDAQLVLRNERRWRDPFYWAAFALQGDWR